MSDRLFLSCWLRGFTEHNVLQHFERVLAEFPYSQFDPRVTLRIYATEITEPPLVERLFAEPDVAEIASAAREFANADCAYEIECQWDLWQFEKDWALRPAPVIITVFAPLFPSDLGEQLLIDFGMELLYLPPDDETRNLVAVQSNIRSMLHLAEDIEESLPVDKRTLWSEADDNLAERLEEALAEG